MIRMPDGIGGQRFFQKHWEQERPRFVETITLFSSSKDESHEYLLCNNLPTLLWLAQSGTLEFHVWHSRARLGADAHEQERPTTPAPRRRWRPRCSTTPTTWCSTSIPTSTPGKRSQGRRARAEHRGVREGQGGRVLAARAAAEHVARGDRQDLGQDRPARVRADPPHDRFRRRARGEREGRAPPDARCTRRTSRSSGACRSAPGRSSWTTT